jgi:hypothetical protein
MFLNAKKAKVNDLLKLYGEGKIFSKIEVQKAIGEYIAPSSNPQQQELKYHQTMVRIFELPHHPQRKQQEKRQATRTKKQFEQITKELKEKLQARKEARERALKTYVVHAMLYSNTPNVEGQKPNYKYKHLDYFIITYREFTVKAASPFPSELYRKFASGTMMRRTVSRWDKAC